MEPEPVLEPEPGEAPADVASVEADPFESGPVVEDQSVAESKPVIESGEEPLDDPEEHFAADDDGFGYAIALGSAAPSSVPKVFERDPEIKHEAVWAGPQPRAASLLVQREGPNLRVRDEAGRGWARVDRPVPG